MIRHENAKFYSNPFQIKRTNNLPHEDIGDDIDAKEKVEQPEHVEYDKESSGEDTDTWSDDPTKQSN